MVGPDFSQFGAVACLHPRQTGRSIAQQLRRQAGQHR